MLKREISAGFISDYFIGHNILYNLEILEALYEIFYKEEHWCKKNCFIKPIYLLNVSIIEAVIVDFYNRISNPLREEYSQKITNNMRNRLDSNNEQKRVTLQMMFNFIKEFNVFDRDEVFYDYLARLLDLRNRVHIQNSKRKLELRDKDAFTEKRLIGSEKVCEYLIKFISENYKRSEEVRFNRNFYFPWKVHSSLELS